MTTTALDSAFATLTSAVEVEREAAEVLAGELTGVRRLLEAAAHEELSARIGDLELAAACLEAAGRRREQARGDLCGALGIEDRRCTLVRLAARAPAPWAARLAADRAALRELSDRIAREAVADRRRAERDLGALHQLVGEGAPSSGNRDLSTPPSVGERRLVADLGIAPLVTELRLRELTYEAIIAVTSDLAPGGRRLSAAVGTVQPD